MVFFLSFLSGFWFLQGEATSRWFGEGGAALASAHDVQKTA
jgi:hypothetical protein